MKSSPERRSWPAWLSQANAKARSISCRSSDSARIGSVLGDHGEEVAEERTLVGRQLAGDRVGPGRARLAGGLADARVTPTILIADGLAVGERLAVRLVGYACALLCRNRMASWSLAIQAP